MNFNSKGPIQSLLDRRDNAEGRLFQFQRSNSEDSRPCTWRGRPLISIPKVQFRAVGGHGGRGGVENFNSKGPIQRPQHQRTPRLPRHFNSKGPIQSAQAQGLAAIILGFQFQRSNSELISVAAEPVGKSISIPKVQFRVAQCD